MEYFTEIAKLSKKLLLEGKFTKYMTKDFFSFYSRIFNFLGIHSNSQPEAETEPEEEDI